MKKLLLTLSFLLLAYLAVSQDYFQNGAVIGKAGMLFSGDSAAFSEANGSFYYNTISDRFRFRENGVWRGLGGGGTTPDSTNFWRTKSNFDIFLPQFGSRNVNIVHNPGDGNLNFMVNSVPYFSISDDLVTTRSGDYRLDITSSGGIRVRELTNDSVALHFDSSNGGEGSLYNNGDQNYFSFIDEDGTYSNVRVADPVNNSDAVTKGFADDNYWSLSGDFSTVGGQFISLGLNNPNDFFEIGFDWQDGSNLRTSLAIYEASVNNGGVDIGTVDLNTFDFTGFRVNTSLDLVLVDNLGSNTGASYDGAYSFPSARHIPDRGYVDSNLRGSSLPTISGQAGNSIRVNGAGTAWEYYTPSGGGSSVDTVRIYDSLAVHRDSINDLSAYTRGKLSGQDISSIGQNPTASEDGKVLAWDNANNEWDTLTISNTSLTQVKANWTPAPSAAAAADGVSFTVSANDCKYIRTGNMVNVQFWFQVSSNTSTEPANIEGFPGSLCCSVSEGIAVVMGGDTPYRLQNGASGFTIATNSTSLSLDWVDLSGDYVFANFWFQVGG